MKAYYQKADGSEVTLIVQKPDPEDGTFVVIPPKDQELVLDGIESWIRIVLD